MDRVVGIIVLVVIHFDMFHHSLVLRLLCLVRSFRSQNLPTFAHLNFVVLHLLRSVAAQFVQALAELQRRTKNSRLHFLLELERRYFFTFLGLSLDLDLGVAGNAFG